MGLHLKGSVEKFAKRMSRDFEMSMMGELSFFLGVRIKQYDNGIFVSQTKYIHAFLKNFGMTNSRHSATPMSTIVKLYIDLARKDVDETLCRSTIGSLLYLTASRLDIAYNVGVYGRY